MHEPTRDHELPAGPLLRALPLVGFAAILALALAWSDRLPGGYFLRRLVEPNSIRDERELAEHAAQRLSRFARENAAATRDAIVFIGSSTIERYPLEQCFPGKPCLNRGILSAGAPLLERFIDTLVPNMPVAGIVLYVGSIDLREPGRSADPKQVETVVERVRSLLDRIIEAQPATPIVLIGVLPKRRMDAGEVAVLALLDTRLSELARARGIAFVDTARAPLSSPEGALVEELSADDLHLNERGYQALSTWVEADGGEVGRRLRP